VLRDREGPGFLPADPRRVRPEVMPGPRGQELEEVLLLTADVVLLVELWVFVRVCVGGGGIDRRRVLLWMIGCVGVWVRCAVCA
jgi:hypothetical protein